MKNTIKYYELCFQQLTQLIKQWGMTDLGFQQVGIADVDLHAYEKRYQAWIAQGFQGEMHYLVKHGCKRTDPAQLIPGTLRAISVRLDYLPEDGSAMQRALKNKRNAYISRYALGRDYHKLMRKRLAQLANKITQYLHEHFREHHPSDHANFRVFCDSAPVLEKPLAELAGLGWIGKHTNLINAKAGSWFFLGEIYTNLPLTVDAPQTQSHCGSCTACIDICPTKAIIAPYLLDARRCISYLTIELRDAIPIELRPLMGNRIYGCDDCQIICPWNKFAKFTKEKDFHPRHQLASAELLDLFHWSEEMFKQRTEGSAIRRISYAMWLRNIAIALGNAPADERIIAALRLRANDADALVREHVVWALEQQMRHDYHR